LLLDFIAQVWFGLGFDFQLPNYQILRENKNICTGNENKTLVIACITVKYAAQSVYNPD